MSLDKHKEETAIIKARYIQSDEVKFIEGNHLANVLGPEADREIEAYDKKLTKMISKVDPNREKSINPMWDRLEKQIVQPEEGVIYTKEQMKNLGIEIFAPRRFTQRDEVSVEEFNSSKDLKVTKIIIEQNVSLKVEKIKKKQKWYKRIFKGK